MTPTNIGALSKGPKKNLADYAHHNKAWANINRWQNKRVSKVGRALENGYRLKEQGKVIDFGPNVAEVHSEHRLQSYMRVELLVTVVCLAATVMSGIMATEQMAFLIITVLAIWFGSISYRFYRHHVKCYWHLRSLNALRCPHCGNSLGHCQPAIEGANPSNQ